MKLRTSQWVFSPLPSASCVSSCILQGEGKLEERMKRIIYVFFTFQVAEGLHVHTEQASPESIHFSGTSQVKTVCDLRAKAETTKSKPLTLI